MPWYFSKAGAQFGPVTAEQVRAKLASGDLDARDLVWRDGMADWLPAARVPEFASLIPAGGEPPAVSPYAAPRLPAAGMAEIPNYLWQAIVVTILCCWPLGIPAIVYASKVDGLKIQGDVAGATAASSNAKLWCLLAAGGWLVLVLPALLFLLWGYAAAATRMH